MSEIRSGAKSVSRRDRHGRPAVHLAAGAAIPGSTSRWLAASERSEGKAYADAAPWRLRDADARAPCATERSRPACPGAGPKVVFSALDATAADELEHAVRRRRPHRPQQRAQPPHGSARAAAHSRGQRRSPLRCSPSSAERRAGRARSSPIRIARRSCSRWRWRRCGSSASARVHGDDDAGGVGRGVSGRAVARHPRQRRSRSSAAAKKRRSRPRR